MDKHEETWIELLAHRRQQYDKLIGTGGAMERWTKAFNLKHYQEDDEGSSDAGTETASWRHRDTVPYDYVSQLKAMLDVPDPVRSFWVENETSEAAKELVDKAEKYVAGVWRINGQRAQVSPKSALIHNQLVLGRAYAYVYWDRQRQALYERNGNAANDAYFPICIATPNPRHVFPNPEDGHWGWTDDLIYAQSLSPARVAKMWGKAKVLPLLGHVSDDEMAIERDSETEVGETEGLYDYVDIWAYEVDGSVDGEPTLWNGIIYNGQWLKEPQALPKYKKMPFVLIPGIDLPDEDVALRHRSVLFPVIPTYQTLEHIVNRIMTAATFQADPIILAKVQDPMQFTKHAGAVWPLKDNEQISYLLGAGVNPQLFQMYSIVSGDLERSSLARVNYGNAPASWSGYMANQAIAGSSLKNQAIAENLAKGLSEIDQRILDLTGAFSPDKVMVAYGTLRGSKFRVKVKGSELKDLNVLTVLIPKTPADEQSKIGVAMMYRNPGAGGLPLMSDDWIRRNILNVEDAHGAETALWRERVMTMPSVQRYFVRQWAEASGLPKDVVDGLLAEMEQEPGTPAGGAAGGVAGAPGAPGQPAPAPGGLPAPAGQPTEGGQPTPDQAMQVIQALIAQGQIPPETANLPQDIQIQAGTMVMQGVPADQVVAFIQEQLAGGQAPGQAPGQMAGPQTQPQQVGQANEQMKAQALRTEIQTAMQSQEIPPELAQQALAMLDQGQPADQVYQWILQQAQAMQGQEQQPGTMPPEMQGPMPQGQPGMMPEQMPQGQGPMPPQQPGPAPMSITPEQVVAFMRQRGFDDDVIQLFLAFIQQGYPIMQALQMTLAQASGLGGQAQV